MNFLTWQNPEQLFIAQVLKKEYKQLSCGIKVIIIMWPFNYFKKKREKEEQRRRREEENVRLQKLEQERIARERERHLEENRKKEEQRKAEKERMSSITPFSFKSNCHQRYENGYPKLELQECIRTVSVEKNTNGCKGYKLEPGFGYIVKIFNNDLDKPNMSDKPMIVVRKTENSIELRGFSLEAMSPFGWQKVDYSDYGFIVYYQHGKVSKCVLHMYDRNTFIEYRYTDKTPLARVNTDSSVSECEQFAQLSQDSANQGNTSKSHQYGLKVYDSIIKNPMQIEKILDIQSVALALGRLMEGNYFSDNDSIKKAVGLSYYFISKSIAKGNKNPYLYAYRFSITWEYNKVFYHLFAHSEDSDLDTNPFSPFGQSMVMAYVCHLQGMQMADMLTEPYIAHLDPALGNIFNEIFARYSSTPKQQIISIGNQYHEQIFDYLKAKIQKTDFDF